MNEERLEAYRNLVQELLSCPDGEEWELLQAHQELLDSDFIQVMEQVAEELEEKGDEKGTDFLQKLAYTLVSSSAYKGIIEQLLNCANDEEAWRILDANRDWVDSGLQETMLEVAEDLRSQGDLDKSNFLMNIVIQQMGLGLELSTMSLPSSDTASRLDFLIKLLNVIHESGWNSQYIYPFLQANQNLLDYEFVKVLKSWTPARLVELEAKQAKEFAEDLADLGDKLKNFSLGNRAINLEIAIASYEIAAQVLNYETYPEKWARLQSILASIYLQRTKGDTTENIETAIQCGKRALQVRTHQASPREWATTQSHLGNAYSMRIKGDKEENLEKGISYYKAALRGYNWQNCLRYPEKWAEVLVNLGKVYGQRIRGTKKKNLKFQIRCYEAALKVFTRRDFHEMWDRIQADLSVAYSNLGYAHLSNDSRGNQQDIELALHFYKKARNSARDPVQWVICTLGLGGAYSRLQDKNQQNLEKAIKYYEAVLKVPLESPLAQCFLDQQNLLLLWALAHSQLYNAYRKRVLGNRGDNVEKAIQHCQLILEHIRYEDSPRIWAGTQTNLGLAYSERIYGEQAKNIEMAIDCHKAALNVVEYQSQEWARAQWNLGIAYGKRLRGNPVENLETAIDCLQESQRVFTRQAFPEEWARIQIVLGSVYRRRIWSNYSKQKLSTVSLYKAEELEATNQRGRAENLEAAIHCYESALEVLTCQSAPRAWAELQGNLGNAYSDRILGERARNLENAIHCFEASLDVFNRQDFPQQWAMTKMNLGLTYCERILGYKQENLKQSIHFCRSALEVFTCQGFPHQHVQCLSNLGLVYRTAQQFHNSYSVCDRAIKAVESLRFAITSGSTIEEDKTKLAEQFNQLYKRMIEVCLELAKDDPHYYDRAIEFVERSKARNLVELLSIKSLYPTSNADTNPSDYQQICNELDFLRHQIPVKQRQLEMIGSQNSERDNREFFIEIQKELNDLLQQQNQLFEKIASIDPSFKFSQQVPFITFAEIQSLVDQRTAIVEWYFTKERVITFIITRQHQHPIVLQFTDIDSHTLWKFGYNYLTAYKLQTTQWRSTLIQELQRLAQILHLDEILSKIPKICDQLILIPHERLHLFPLHGFPLPRQQNQCLLDKFKRGVRYAPSCQLLQLSQQQQRSDFSSLFATQNPTDDLEYASLEVEVIRTFFSSSEVLASKAASEAAIKVPQNLERVHCCHFSCHGYFDLGSPLNSGLVLAESQKSDLVKEQNLEDGYLTLTEIFGLNLEQCRLVTLSACETGMIDPVSLSDEYIGLPSGFLYAGSPSVISSLWMVNDLSTAFLMIKFYENLKESLKQHPNLEAGDMAIGLSQAQLWLRDATKEELQQWTNHLALSRNHREQLDDWFYKLIPLKFWLLLLDKDSLAGILFLREYQPFKEPYHWAAFCAIGQ